MRAFALAALALAFAAPSAGASVEAPDHLPVFGPADGVRVDANRGTITFGATADKVYRTLAGRRAYAVCGAFTERMSADYIGGNRVPAIARKRGPVRVSTGGRPDVCALATARKNLEDSWCRPLRAELPGWCARVIVPVTARGRAYLDRLHAAVTLTGADDQITSLPPDWAPTPVELLQGAVEARVVALDDPDGTPPAGKLGLFGDGAAHTLAVRLADGSRLFLRREGDVITTNVTELFGRTLTVF
jgi:hypothetical protein